MLLDQFVPNFQFRETHTITIKASSSKVLESARSIRPGDVPLVGFLMALRSIPAVLFKGERYTPGRPDVPFLDQIVGTGFFVLGEEPGRELVLGTIGQFWRPTGNLCRDILTPDQFLNFREEGWAKAGWNFFVEETGTTSRLVTETRIYTLGASATCKFGFYWRTIRGGSGLLRRAILKAIKRRAESEKPYIGR